MIVGFDLDMTLLDSRPGIRRSLDALSAETGVPIDADVVIGRLGPKLEWEMAQWFAPEDVERMADRYRDFYWEYCVGNGTLLFDGARDSVDAVRARGGKILIVTAKSERLSHRCLETVGIDADIVVGHVHGDEKRDALKQHNARVYVGDTVPDIEAGVGAGALAVGVTTGMHNAHELEAAGADAVFASLTEFPAWFATLT